MCSSSGNSSTQRANLACSYTRKKAKTQSVMPISYHLAVTLQTEAGNDEI